MTDVAVGGCRPIWWLGSEDTTEHQINLVWTAHGLDYFLGSNGYWSVDTLKQVAGSL